MTDEAPSGQSGFKLVKEYVRLLVEHEHEDAGLAEFAPILGEDPDVCFALETEHLQLAVNSIRAAIFRTYKEVGNVPVRLLQASMAVGIL